MPICSNAPHHYLPQLCTFNLPGPMEAPRPASSGKRVCLSESAMSVKWPFPMCSIYGIFTYTFGCFLSKCRYTFHTWSVWVWDWLNIYEHLWIPNSIDGHQLFLPMAMNWGITSFIEVMLMPNTSWLWIWAKTLPLNETTIRIDTTSTKTEQYWNAMVQAWFVPNLDDYHVVDSKQDYTTILTISVWSLVFTVLFHWFSKPLALTIYVLGADPCQETWVFNVSQCHPRPAVWVGLCRCNSWSLALCQLCGAKLANGFVTRWSQKRSATIQ